MGAAAERFPGGDSSSRLEFAQERRQERGVKNRHHSDVTFVYNPLPFHLLQRVVPYRNLELYDPDRLHVEPNVSPRLHAVMRHMLREYYAMVSSLDDQVGRLRAALDELHLTGDTVIIYTSDHGDLVGSHATERYRGKSLPYQNAYRVPLLVAGADIPPGTVVDTPVGSVDLLPTILELAGLQPAPQLPGRPVTSAPRGDSDVVLMGLRNWRGIFDGRYRYAVAFDTDGARPILLVDTERDPHDIDNLLASAAPHPHARRLHHQLYAKLQEVGDAEGLARARASHPPQSAADPV